MNEGLTVFVVKLFRALLYPSPNTEARFDLARRRYVGRNILQFAYRDSHNVLLWNSYDNTVEATLE